MSTIEARRAANRRFYQRHKEEEKTRSKKWRQENLDKYNMWAEKNKEKRRAASRKFEYNITSEEYEQKKTEQGGKCAICNQLVDLLVVDHDHLCCSKRRTCGNCNRGLLCRSCNTLIGLAGESIDVLLSAIKYLQKYRKA